ncbi:dephospho-CoA kinase [uncultured Limosilactobacillus sp.]|uniref:dephospho-CoA kinase n=1 Tax=uncultured Limosilactobacillus sp. TaxID=2837629 RepID=UPI0025E34DEC|nr:dephospho-CoA kinase [uncultured Limosilactobacillus sp.]
MTKIIGLTGGIASGKSTVSNYLRRLGYPVVDADQIARQVVEPGSIGLKRVIATFGTGFVTLDGKLDRHKLGQLVFNDHQQMQTLNDLLQPLIRQKIIKQLTKHRTAGAALVFLDAPLLFEQHYDPLCDLVLVVTVSHQVQLKRLMNRDQLTVTEAKSRINSQLPMAVKIKRADVIIDNNSTLQTTKRQVQQWLESVQN